MRFNYEAVNMSSYYELYLYYYKPYCQAEFFAPYWAIRSCIIWISLIFRHKLVHAIYKHYKFTELRPTCTYSNTLVCFKIFHFIKFTFQNRNRCIWNMWKNKPGRGAIFIFCPRAQNCLATPLLEPPSSLKYSMNGPKMMATLGAFHNLN